MVSLIDTNILIRYLAADYPEYHQTSKEILEKISRAETQAIIMSEVIMEVLFVMTKQYEMGLGEVEGYLQQLLRLDGIVNQDKYILIEALDTMQKQKIDYVDALICAKSKLEGYGKISFDNDILNKCD